MKCVSCRQGYTWECTNEGRCTAGNSTSNTSTSFDQSGDIPSEHTGSEEAATESPERDEENSGYIPGRPIREVETYKDDAVLRDQQSTGRKRAAEMYPLYPEEACEWRGKKNVGGNIAITGCISGQQQARHHGPDKNTLNNEEGNVHRICHNCHNRWHTVNDPDYVWSAIYEPHSPVSATPLELINNQAQWSTRSTVKAKD